MQRNKLYQTDLLNCASIYRYKFIHDAWDILKRRFRQWIRRNTSCMYSEIFQKPLLNFFIPWSYASINESYISPKRDSKEPQMTFPCFCLSDLEKQLIIRPLKKGARDNKSGICPKLTRNSS
jgi:hypothetical protein